MASSFEVRVWSRSYVSLSTGECAVPWCMTTSCLTRECVRYGHRWLARVDSIRPGTRAALRDHDGPWSGLCARGWGLFASIAMMACTTGGFGLGPFRQAQPGAVTHAREER